MTRRRVLSNPLFRTDNNRNMYAGSNDDGTHPNLLKATGAQRGDPPAITQQWPTSERKYKMIVKRAMCITGSDGTTLVGDLFRPADAGKLGRNVSIWGQTARLGAGRKTLRQVPLAEGVDTTLRKRS